MMEKLNISKITNQRNLVLGNLSVRPGCIKQAASVMRWKQEGGGLTCEQGASLLASKLSCKWLKSSLKFDRKPGPSQPKAFLILAKN
jgi:hypothetical protein